MKKYKNNLMYSPIHREDINYIGMVFGSAIAGTLATYILVKMTLFFVGYYN